VKVQQQVPEYDGSQPADRYIRYRVGINISDVISEGTNLHGDGVNIAARLEALSPIGGVCVSRAVVEHVQSRLNLPFEPIGPLRLKNIDQPVEAFVLRLGSDAVGQRRIERAELEQPWPRKPIGAIRGRLLAILASAGWRTPRDRISAPIASAVAPAASHPATYHLQDRRMSVIVLPSSAGHRSGLCFGAE
jgi:hypothetical protein